MTSTSHLDPSGIQWRGVSRKLIGAELIASFSFWGVVMVVAIVLAVTLEAQWPLWVLGVSAVIFVLDVIFTFRRVRSYGYELRSDDLVFRKGIMFHRIVAVPYGRMQLVDINRGPLSRAFGLSELKFVTAAAASAVVIPGLPEAEAEQLRDELVALAETRRAGL